MGVEITLSDRVACGYPDGNHFDWLATTWLSSWRADACPTPAVPQFTIENVRARPAPSPNQGGDPRIAGRGPSDVRFALAFM
jgi:hypothetical protein